MPCYMTLRGDDDAFSIGEDDALENSSVIRELVRHSRESGNPAPKMDPRLRGDDDALLHDVAWG
jgi:hypothetical protein